MFIECFRRAEQQMRADGNMMRMEEERRREMMMRASNSMNREGGMPQGPQGPPGGPRGPPPPNRPEEMMRGGVIFFNRLFNSLPDNPSFLNPEEEAF